MASKRNSDQSENLRQAVKSFRDVFDALFQPLPSGLENIILVERIGEDLNVSLPIVDFSPFDALPSDTNIEIGTNPATDITHQRYRNTDWERHQTARLKGRMPQSNSQTKRETQDRWGQTSSVRPPFKSNNGNFVAMEDTASSASRVQHFTVRDTTPQAPAKHNNKSVRQGLRFIDLNTATPFQITFDEMSAVSVNANPIPVQNNSSETMTALCTMPQGNATSPTDPLSHPQQHRKNTQLHNRQNSAEAAHDNKKGFKKIQLIGKSTDSNSRQILSNSLAQIGMMADELLQSTAENTIEKVKTHSSSAVECNLQGSDNSRLSVGDRTTQHNTKFHQRKGDTPSIHLYNTTHTVLGNSMAGDVPDKDAITKIVNEVLVEQAKRHGVDLS
ncbi:MAG: hypothetical protein JW786_06535 [Desulfobacterales bacterium]|nr:hypothetical protein [Desulfobacterales bacterium]